MDFLGLMISIMSGKKIKNEKGKKNEIIKENLKKYATSKNKMKKLNVREPKEKMNYSLHVTSRILQLKDILISFARPTALKWRASE